MSTENPPPLKKAKVATGIGFPTKSSYKGTDFELKCINNIRAFSADMPEIANSGHPGAPMGCAPITHLLWSEIMNYSPLDPEWWNRDRFVLSNGHACALQYTMLHVTGYDLTLEDCKGFRKLGSKTPGHPENFCTAGIEVSTGPLGQGISNAVGLAIAEKHMEATYNTALYPGLFDHNVYVICGDGCLQEGVSSEACSLAGHLGLGKLIVMYDDNNITIDGPTDLSFTEDVAKRFEAYNWHVQSIGDVGEDGLEDLRTAIKNAQEEKDRPSLIKVKTVIGYGSAKANTHGVHGAPLGEADLKETKKKYGLDPDKSFFIEEDVKAFYVKKAADNEVKRTKWNETFQKYKLEHPEKAAELERRFSRKLPDKLFEHLPNFEYGKDDDLATRKFSQQCLSSIAPYVPELIGGSADLTPSNLTQLQCSTDFQKSSPEGRYLRFGVREHGMSAICNGLFAYGCFRPFCATFLNFAGYAMGAIRLSALSKFGIIYVMTHDSIGLGEDGPTHQPVEMLESLRSMPNIYVLRPADCNETVASYQIALTKVNSPSVICCSRSNVQALKESTVEKALKGAYSVVEEDEPDLIIVATGTEVECCIDASEQLKKLKDIKTRVVSMPCQELFLEQSEEYQNSVLPGNVPTLSVEASAVSGWHRFSHAQIGMTRFGLSGKGKDVFQKFGFTAVNVLQKGKELVEFYKKDGCVVPNLNMRPVFENFMAGDDDGH